MNNMGIVDTTNAAMSQYKNAMPRGAYSSKHTMQPEQIPKGYNKYQMQNFTPEQYDLLRSSMGHVDENSYLSKLAYGDESTYADMEAPALRQYSELQGGLASRFSGQGMGARNSSGFQNTQNAAAQDFASKLQANRHDIRTNAIKDLLGMSNDLMGQRPYSYGLAEKPPKKEKEKSGWTGVAGAVVGGIAGMYVGNPYMGATMGYAAGNAFA